MVRTFERDDRTVWVMPRDDQALLWFSIVRIADMQGLRWLLGALNGLTTPVSVRRAQAWSARMESVGLVQRAQLGGGGGALVWGTHAGTGVAKPDLYRQTTRHEVAVAAASAHYAAAGYAWQRDEKPAHLGGHQADGIALSLDWVELTEVELTPKRMNRYAQIFSAFEQRLRYREATAITYLCDPSSAAAVRFALEDLSVGRAIASHVAIRAVFDRRGLWAGETLPAWLPTARQRAIRGREAHVPAAACDEAAERAGGHDRAVRDHSR